MDVMEQRCAGVDLGKADCRVCIWVPEKGGFVIPAEASACVAGLPIVFGRSPTAPEAAVSAAAPARRDAWGHASTRHVVPSG